MRSGRCQNVPIAPSGRNRATGETTSFNGADNKLNAMWLNFIPDKDWTSYPSFDQGAPLCRISPNPIEMPLGVVPGQIPPTWVPAQHSMLHLLRLSALTLKYCLEEFPHSLLNIATRSATVGTYRPRSWGFKAVGCYPQTALLSQSSQ